MAELKNIRIAKSGVYKYAASEIPSLHIKNQMPDWAKGKDVYCVYRPASVLAAAVDKFKMLPLTHHHPTMPVDGTNFRELAVGYTSDSAWVDYIDGSDEVGIRSTMILYDNEALNAYDNGEVQLSPGYTADFEWKQGIAPDGTEYDIVMNKISNVNHLAVLPCGRGGKDAVILDAGFEEGHVSHRKDGDYKKEGGEWHKIKGDGDKGNDNDKSTSEKTIELGGGNNIKIQSHLAHYNDDGDAWEGTVGKEDFALFTNITGVIGGENIKNGTFSKNRETIKRLGGGDEVRACIIAYNSKGQKKVIFLREENAKKIESAIESTKKDVESDDYIKFKQAESDKERENEVNRAKFILENSKKSKIVENDEERRKYLKQYNNVYNEGGEGYLPPVYTKKEIEEAEKIVSGAHDKAITVFDYVSSVTDRAASVFDFCAPPPKKM